MEKKSLALLCVLGLMFVLCSVGVLSAPAWTAPTSAGTVLYRNYTLSCSSNGNGTIGMEFRWMNNSEVWHSVGNDSAINGTSYTVGFDTTAYVDTLTGTLNCTELQDSGGEIFALDTTLDADIDNTAPSNMVVQVRKPVVEILSTSGTTVICSGSDNHPSRYDFTLVEPDGDYAVTNKSASDGDGSDRVTLRTNDFKMYGEYTVYCTLVDVNGYSTDSGVDYITVSSKDGDEVTVSEPVSKPIPKKGKSNFALYAVMGMAVVVVMVAGFWFVTSQAKPKRRR